MSQGVLYYETFYISRQEYIYISRQDYWFYGFNSSGDPRDVVSWATVMNI